MNQQLEELLKAWHAYQEAPEGPEAKRLHDFYESRLDDVCARSKAGRELLHRTIERAYQRWQWADDPAFPRNLRKIKLE